MNLSPELILILLVVACFLTELMLYNFLFNFISIRNLSASFSSSYDPVRIILIPSLLVWLSYYLSQKYNTNTYTSALWMLSLAISLTNAFAMTMIGRLSVVLTGRWIIYRLESLILSLVLIASIENYSRLMISSTAIIISTTLLIFVTWRTLVDYGYHDYYEKALAEYLNAKYRKKYSSLLNEEMANLPELTNIFFTIMTIEQMNRPGIFRLFERLLFSSGKITTTGIMQVASKQYLSNKESIFAAQKIILKEYKRYTLSGSKKSLVATIASVYNPADSYIELVTTTHDHLIKHI